MQRRAFTIIEILLAMSIVLVVGALSIPSYQYYTIINDLEQARDQVKHALYRAQLLSQLNESDSSWGYHVTSGSIYKGITYAARDASFDEIQPLPISITPSGLPEVSFTILTGEPSATGSIILTAPNGLQRVITILGGGSMLLQGDEEEQENDFLTICHHTGHSVHTIKVPEAAWPGHMGHGDTLGTCPS